MTFSAEVKDAVNKYAAAHIGSLDWHVDFFAFIADDKLAKRLGEEFYSARVLYKIMTGLEAKDWMLRAQIRNQIFSYASIYEAVIHHLLFDMLSTNPRVVALTKFPTRKLISIPRKHQDVLQK
jgi:hypothetical protein